MKERYSQDIRFEEVLNFRDLGGYKARGGHTIAWRRIFRSGELLKMTEHDKAVFKDEIRLKTVIDLRTPEEPEKLKEIRLLEEIGANYFNVPFRPAVIDYYKKEMELYLTTTNMGVVYLHRISHETFGRMLINLLEIIAEPEYFPLLFHCGAGKDRTGILAAILLSILGVSDADIICDYVLTDVSMENIRRRMANDTTTREEVRNLPDFTWSAVPESMKWFLTALKNEYGSAEGYLKKHGAEKTLVKRLEKTLLV